jgi:tryptophanyl-tRNA synthetase
MQSPDGASKKRVLSGVQPSGKLHIGNYFGALKQFVELQQDHDCMYMIADLHSLTSVQDAALLRQQVLDVVIDYLAIGIDPERSVIFKQSSVPAHAELAWVFETITTVPFLMRAHAFKDAEAKNKEINVGLFNYPLLMAADILLYDPSYVPVGQDQKQHVEIARDTAEKFNHVYNSEVFKLPEPMIIEGVAVVPGTDGQKMSKSKHNTIPLFATDEEITKAVMSIATDSRGRDEEKDPDELILYQIHKLFNPSADLKAQYAQGLGYGDAKKLLIADIIAFVTPMRERRKRYEDDPALVKKILEDGAKKANEIAMAKLSSVYEAVGLN